MRRRAGSATTSARLRERRRFFRAPARSSADRIWLSRLAGNFPEPGFLGPDGIRSLDQDLASDFRMVRRGKAMGCPLWWVVAPVCNHQTHHRGQLTTLLFQAGQDPGATDLFAMLIEESSAPP